MRFYLIGAGFISRTHMESLRKLGLAETSPIKVCDANPKALSEFLQLYPKSEGFASAAEMLAEQPAEGDVVIVGTPPSTHYSLAMQGLESGRHVLCEKPLVLQSAEADTLLAEANRRGLLLGCCSSRFSGLAKAQTVRQWLDEGKIGQPYKFTFVHRANRSRPGIEYQPQSRWFLDRSVAGGGILLDWGPYDIAALNEILQPERVEVHGAWHRQPVTSVDPADVVNNVETHCGAMMRFVLEGDQEVWVHYERSSCTHGKAYSHCELEGTHGAITWNSLYGGQSVTLSTDREGKVDEQEQSVPEPGDFGPMDNPVRWFVRRLESGTGAAVVNGQAVFNLRCVLAVYRRAETGEIQIVNREDAGR